MNWITNSVLPKIKALVQPREVPENFWTKCPNCGEMIFHRQLEDNLQVCPKCNYHLKLAARARLESLFELSLGDAVQHFPPLLNLYDFA